MDNRELALFIAEFLDGRKADDIAIIYIAEKSGFADYFVICTAGRIRQLQAMSADLEDKVAEKGTLVHHVEGKGESGWILMDFGDIIVKICQLDLDEILAERDPGARAGTKNMNSDIIVTVFVIR